MPEPNSDSDPHPRWPWGLAVFAPVLSIPLPTLTARRLRHAPLWLGYLAHLAGALMGFGVLMLLAVLDEWHEDQSFVDLVENTYISVIELVNEYRTEPLIFLAHAGITAVVFAFVEVVTLLVAWSMTAWSARAEPLWRSFRRSLSTTWLITAHACLYIALFGGFSMWAERVRMRWMYSTDWDWDNIPWWIDMLRFLTMGLFALLCMLLTVVLFRTYSGRGWRPVSRWPAHCEGCGYSLMGMPLSGSCPECGLALTASTSHSRRDRPLTAGGLALIKDWFIATCTTVVMPGRQGRRCKVYTPARHRAGFFALTAMGVAGISFTGCMLMFLSGWLHHGDAPEPTKMITACVFFSGISILIAAMVTFAAPSVVGTSARLFTGRDLMPHAVNGSLSLGSVLFVWGVLFWLKIFLITVLMDWLELGRHMRRNMGINPEVVIVPLVFGLPVVMILIYLILLGRFTWAGRHANT